MNNFDYETISNFVSTFSSNIMTFITDDKYPIYFRWFLVKSIQLAGKKF